MAESRECGMMCITGIQGVGKTYQNMHTIKDYVKDKFYNKVKGRKVLIFDTNGSTPCCQLHPNKPIRFYP